MGYVVGKALQLGWAGQLRDAQLLLGSLSDKDIVPFQNPMRYSLLAVVFAKLGSRAEAVDALSKYDAATEGDTDPHPVFNRARGLAERYTILANVILQRNALAQKHLRTLRPATADLKPFDAALAALLNRVPEQYEAALRDMRLAGIAGIARFLDAVGGGCAPAESDETEVLTPVELQVLRAMAQGLSNQAIADDQRRTVNTVRTHVSSILRKLSCGSRGEAVAAARRQELV
jgi:DNA-binding CsgD family transcriptional regulator